jgi:hypothetical protein
VDGSQSTLAAALGTISGLASGTDVVYVLSPGTESMAPTEVSNVIGPVTVTIDGGGREVTLAFRNITLKGRGLGVTNNDTLIRVERGGTLELGTGAKITGNKNSSSYGSGVYVDNGGTFTLWGGGISANTACDGGGVYVDNGGTFTMNDGEISANTATSSDPSYGGGVFVSGGSFTMNGGEISANTAREGGGVSVSGGSFTMSDGEITGNTYGGVFVSGNFTMSGRARVNVNNPVCLSYVYDFSSSFYYSSTITIGGDLNGPAGPVAQIDLQADNNTPWSTWLGLQVIKTDYSGNVAILRNRFTLGNFIAQRFSGGSYTYSTTPITDTDYEIGSDGTLRAVTP